MPYNRCYQGCQQNISTNNVFLLSHWLHKICFLQLDMDIKNDLDWKITLCNIPALNVLNYNRAECFIHYETFFQPALERKAVWFQFCVMKVPNTAFPLPSPPWVYLFVLLLLHVLHLFLLSYILHLEKP